MTTARSFGAPADLNAPPRPAPVPSAAERDLSVVLPVMNEEGNIAPLLARLVPVLEGLTPSYEIVFIDDGSTDRTAERVLAERERNPRVTLLRLSRNFGQHFAAQAGLDFARGRRVLWMDADLQEPPEAIPAFMAKMDEGFDMVYGYRTTVGGSRFKRLGSLAYVALFNRLSRQPQPMNAAVMRLMSRRFVEALKALPERVRFITALCSFVGYPRAGVEISYGRRTSGRTKYNLGKMINNALDAILSFSMVPLKWITATGFAVAASSVAFALLILFMFLFGIWNPGVTGWTSTIVAIFFLGGVQLIFLGLIGEYVGRIYFEVKGRPLYIVAEIHDAPPENAAGPGA